MERTVSKMFKDAKIDLWDDMNFMVIHPLIFKMFQIITALSRKKIDIYK